MASINMNGIASLYAGAMDKIEKSMKHLLELNGGSIELDEYTQSLLSDYKINKVYLDDRASKGIAVQIGGTLRAFCTYNLDAQYRILATLNDYEKELSAKD